MLVLFVHGWSARHTSTYGELPEALAALAPQHGLELEIRHLYLGRYISFHDEVTVDDIARAFDQAIRTDIPQNANGRRIFSCITHSTGAPVIRTWIDQYFGAGGLDRLPLRHLVMLAPANHGSALAQLGKARLGRIKAWFQGVDPGKRVLDWLEFGSREQVELNSRWLQYELGPNRFFPFVLCGEHPDKKLYDHLNSYTGEKGSDGVVRLCAANLNFRRVRLRQTDTPVDPGSQTTTLEVAGGPIEIAPETAFGVFSKASHSGIRTGIMRSVKASNAGEKVVPDLLRCLEVQTPAQYHARRQDLAEMTKRSQTDPRTGEPTEQFSMVVLELADDRGDPIYDYDMLFLAGKRRPRIGDWVYDPDELPMGFSVDRQRNSRNPNRLTYYLSHTRMMAEADRYGHRLGLRITARPGHGFSYYRPAEFRSFDAGLEVGDLLRPNETLIVQIELKRYVDENIFRLDPATAARRGFKKQRPSGLEVP